MKKRILTAIFPILSVFLVNCVSNQVLSSGAVLPQSSNEFSDGPIKVKVSHHCDSGRCTSLSAEFENSSGHSVEIIPAQSRLVRAGQSYTLGRIGEHKGNFVVPAHDSVSEEFHPLGEAGKQPMSYVIPKKVYCSLEPDPLCQNFSAGAARCAGFARYYYETYTSTGGWIALIFAYVTDGRNEFIASPTPIIAGNPPPVQLSLDEGAPRFGSNPDDIVFLKMQCNAQCRCTEKNKPHNFFLDDKLMPVFKK